MDDADEINRALSELETQLSAIAHVDREAHEHGIVMVEVTPRNSDALPMTWTLLGSEIIFQAGQYGGRWELARTSEDLAFMQGLVKGIVDGRVRETLGPRRSQVWVTMPDGTTVTETGQIGCLPVPGWRRRARTTAFAAYATP